MSDDYLCISSANDCSTTTTAGYTSTVAYYPCQTWTDTWASSDVALDCGSVGSSTLTIEGDVEINGKTLNQIIKEEVTKIDMRTLFKVYVVDPRKNGKILLDGKLVIAVNENQAMLKAGVAEIAAACDLELEQVDVYVQTIGTFIRPKKETQRVKMVEKDEE